MNPTYDHIHDGLIRLFNQQVDWVRQLLDGTYVPCQMKQATHRLVCTRWNSRSTFPTDQRKLLRELKTRPVGYALSVCAMPLHAPRASRIRLLAKPIDLDAMPTYEIAGTIGGKRAVLRWLLRFCRETRALRRRIRTSSSRQLDALYFSLLHANRDVTAKAKRRARRAKRRAAR